MIKVYNNIIPFKGYKALTFWPFVFIRKGAIYNEVDDNHECIHGEQQKETLIVLFYLWYGIEYLIKWAYYRNRHMAYKNVGFEREAYDNQRDIVYVDTRKSFAWLKYIATRKSYYGKAHRHTRQRAGLRQQSHNGLLYSAINIKTKQKTS